MPKKIKQAIKTVAQKSVQKVIQQPAIQSTEQPEEKSFFQSLLDKGDALKSKNKWWGKALLVLLAGLLIGILVIRKNALDKKRAKLTEEKNNAILDLKKQNRALEEEKFVDKVNDINKDIEVKKERVREIKEELRTMGEADVQEKAAFDTIRDWNTFNSYFNK
jgi:hypothetical protein